MLTTFLWTLRKKNSAALPLRGVPFYRRFSFSGIRDSITNLGSSLRSRATSVYKRIILERLLKDSRSDYSINFSFLLETWVSMGVYLDGSYNVPAGLIYSFPVTCKNGEWTTVQVFQCSLLRSPSPDFSPLSTPLQIKSIYVIDLGSADGTFVANERLTKDSPVELEPGQSLRFAASTRIYVLRKDNTVLFPPAPLPAEINLPPSPDPTDEEAVVSYNTLLNRYGLTKSNKRSASSGGGDHNKSTERTAKRIKKLKVAFRDQVGGDVVEVVGISDGADVETEPGPLGVKEGSLVGKYESLVQTTVIPKGKELFSLKESVVTSKGMTDKLQEVLNKVKNPPKGGIYDDLFGSSLSGNVGSSWAFSAPPTEKQSSSAKDGQVNKSVAPSTAKAGSNSGSAYDESDDDLFGD